MSNHHNTNNYISDSLSIGTESQHKKEQNYEQKGGALSGPWNPWSAFWNNKKINTNEKAHIAIDKGNFASVEFFIDEGMITDYNYAPAGDSILHKLIKHNKLELLEKALAQHTGSLDVQDSAGNTLAVLAVQNNLPVKTIELLKQKGANFTIKNNDGVYVRSEEESNIGKESFNNSNTNAKIFQQDAPVENPAKSTEDTETLLKNLEVKYGKPAEVKEIAEKEGEKKIADPAEVKDDQEPETVDLSDIMVQEGGRMSSSTDTVTLKQLLSGGKGKRKSNSKGKDKKKRTWANQEEYGDTSDFLPFGQVFAPFLNLETSNDSNDSLAYERTINLSD